MTFSQVAEVAALAEFVFGLIAGAILLVVQYRILLAITKLKKEVDADIKALGVSIEKEVAKLREYVDTKMDLAQQRQDLQLERMRQEYSTQLSALQVTIHQVEVKGLEMFVRRQSFTEVTMRIEKSIDDIGDRMDAGIANLTKRVDDAVAGRPHAPAR